MGRIWRWLMAAQPRRRNERYGEEWMMKALEAGGMEACYRQSRDEMKNRFADEHYDPNIGSIASGTV